MFKSKIINKIKYENFYILFKVLLDLLLFILFIPFYLLLSFILFLKKNNKIKQKSIIFAGLEHVIDKSVIRGDYFKKKDFTVKYYSFEFTGNRSNNVSEYDVIQAKKLISFDIIYFAIQLIKYKPVYVELYYEGNCFNQYFYVLFSLLSNTLTISILRGELYEFYNKNKVKNKIRVLSWKLCNYIFYREDYMPQYFPIIGIDEKKTFYDHNKVPVNNHPDFKRDNKRVLFLNGIKKWRNIDTFIESAKYVKDVIPNVEYIIVGCRDIKEFQYVSDLVNSVGLTDYFDIKYWSDNPRVYYESASVFVLPADLIFCNFSLLESMERGVPAIVSNVEDADKIIEHGINGFLSEISSDKFASYIIKILSDEKLRIMMGNAAREKILNDYNDKDRMLPIFNLIKKKYSDIIDE